MDNNIKKETEEFITERVNYYGQNETEAVNGAFMELCSCVDRLRKTLSAEQILLLRDCEDAYRLADGETGRFYYEAGFSDAICFLKDWMERP